MTGSTGRVALVTGAAGFVGSHLSKALVAEGWRVHGLGSEPPAETAPLEAWHAAELRDPARLREVLAVVHPDAVLHLAGQSSAARSFAAAEETFRVNALGTWYLLEGVERSAPGARVLVVGSGEVYGPQPEGTQVAESAPFNPVSPYALSKAVADVYALEAARRGLDVVRTRSFAHTGPGQDARFAIPSWARQIAAIERGQGEPVLRVGNLEVTRDVSDVRDVVRAYLSLLARGRSGAVYNVCSGAGARLNEVLRSLTAMARVPLRIEPDPERLRPADLPYLVGDGAALAGETGWRAEIGLEATLAETLSYWRGRDA